MMPPTTKMSNQQPPSHSHLKDTRRRSRRRSVRSNFVLQYSIEEEGTHGLDRFARHRHLHDKRSLIGTEASVTNSSGDTPVWTVRDNARKTEVAPEKEHSQKLELVASISTTPKQIVATARPNNESVSSSYLSITGPEIGGHISRSSISKSGLTTQH
jgi:hypothetical protein